MKFFGLTVKDFRASAGLGQQTSQLAISLIEDGIMGDIANFPSPGTPCYFQFNNFKFFGILQKEVKQISASDGEFYEAILIDPRELLDGVQVFTGGYNGSVLSTYNIVNAYAFYENTLFGSSLANDAGMPWFKVLSAINTICNTPFYGDYGGPVTFMGYAYSLDLSELPIPPVYYRIPYGYLSLLEIIDQICTDSACDYRFELIGFTIKLKTISRTSAPPLGIITNIVNNATTSGIMTRAEVGVELRNENTSAMIIGGQKTGISLTNSIASFWGNDIFGNPVLGIDGIHPGFGACEFMNVNALDCADIIGSVYYYTNTIEMRAALKGPESWNLYLKNYKPAILTIIGNELYGAKDIPYAPNLKQDIVDDSALNVQSALSEFYKSRRERLFDLVRNYAEDFYGKQFLVQIPFILASQDPETLQINTTLEPTSSGYLAGGATALGVPFTKLDVIQDNDERILPFVFFNEILDTDTSRVNWSDTVVAMDGSAFIRIQMEDRIVFTNDIIPLPTVHIKLGSAVYARKFDDLVDANKLIFGPNIIPNQANIIDKNAMAGGTIGFIDLFPSAIYPSVAGIPLKSNIETYGPWIIQGPPGKVRIEQDSSLTPWDYGSESVMNLAGQARVIGAISGTQLVESGTVGLAGAPNFSLGDVMMSGGPNITNVFVNYGTNGITSDYRFETFTPKFGLFSRQNAERIRRISLSQVQQRKELRKLINKAIVAKYALQKAVRGAKFNKAFWQKKQSPHTVFLAQNLTSNSDIRVGVSTEQYESSLVMLNDDGGLNFKNKAAMSMDGLFRGISTNSDSLFSSFDTPTNSYGINLNSLNPFVSGNDIEILSWGEEYEGAHSYHRGNNPNNTRALGLRGPIIVTGWGYGIDGKEYPNSGGSTFIPNTLRSSNLWKTGPVDLLWDNSRKVWTPHDIFRGVVRNNPIAAGDDGHVNPNGYPFFVPVTNTTCKDLETGTEVLIGYIANENIFAILSTTCREEISGSGSGLSGSGNNCGIISFISNITCNADGKFTKEVTTYDFTNCEELSVELVEMDCLPNCCSGGSTGSGISGSTTESGIYLSGGSDIPVGDCEDVIDPTLEYIVTPNCSPGIPNVVLTRTGNTWSGGATTSCAPSGWSLSITCEDGIWTYVITDGGGVYSDSFIPSSLNPFSASFMYTPDGASCCSGVNQTITIQSPT